MDVFFTTVVRSAPLEKGGELVRVEWETKKILKAVPLIPGEPGFTDPNPRGNGRGGRGIVRFEDVLYVANYHTMLLYDRELTSRGKVSNDLFVGLHESTSHEGVLWAASTAIDAAIGFDSTGQLIDSWWPRENPRLIGKYNLEPLKINKSIDNRTLWLGNKDQKGPSHTHLNAVGFFNGQLHVLLNRYGLVYNTATNKVVIEDPAICGCHNLLFVDDKILICDSHGKRVRIYTNDGVFCKDINLLSIAEINQIHEKVMLTGTDNKKPLFVRGACHVGGSRILVGFSPATIAELDIDTGRLLDIFTYSDDVASCIHGIEVWQ